MRNAIEGIKGFLKKLSSRKFLAYVLSVFVTIALYRNGSIEATFAISSLITETLIYTGVEGAKDIAVAIVQIIKEIKTIKDKK